MLLTIIEVHVYSMRMVSMCGFGLVLAEHRYAVMCSYSNEDSGTQHVALSVSIANEVYMTVSVLLVSYIGQL